MKATRLLLMLAMAWGERYATMHPCAEALAADKGARATSVQSLKQALGV